MKLVDFDDRTIARYQGALADAALTRRALELLTTDFGVVRLTSVHGMRPPLRTLLVSVGVLRTMARMAPSAPATPAPADPATPTPPAPTPPTPPTPPQPDPTPPALPDTGISTRSGARRASRRHP